MPRTARMSPEEFAELPTMLSIEETARALAIGRDRTYRAINAGTFEVPVLTIAGVRKCRLIDVIPLVDPRLLLREGNPMKKKPVLRSVPDFPAWDQSFESLLESTPTHQVDYRINHTGDGKINLHRTVTNKEGQTVWTGVVLITSKDDAVDLTTQLVQALADL